MLYCLILALKRMARTVYVPVLLTVIAAAVFFSPILGYEEEMPLAGICDFDKTEQSAAVCEYLTRNGFELCEDETILRNRISKGEYDCGAIIPIGFGEKMTAAELEDSVVFIDSPLSYQPELYRNHLGAAIFGEAAPYISAKNLSGSGIDTAELLEEYRNLCDAGASFGFTMETAEAVKITDNGHAETYVLGTVSLLIFAFLMYAVCDIISGDIDAISHRVGVKRTILNTVVPDMAVRVISLLATVTVSAVLLKIIKGDGMLFSLIVPVFVYSLMIAAFSMLAGALLVKTGRIQIFTFFALVIGLVLCPIYTDLALFIPWLELFRYILPPYWMWLCRYNTAATAAAVVVMMPLAMLALYARFSKRPR